VRSLGGKGMETKRVIEINGIKMEVDLRNAKRVDQFKVGDPVKVLVKNYSSYDCYPGVIVGFDEFKNLPSINVCYIETSYSEVKVKFKIINEKVEDIEIAPLQEFDQKFDLNNALETLDANILKRKRELEDAESKKEWFQKNYGKYFGSFFDLEDEEN
tara:strand:+ start:26703 stop:27176 length:474 start_codon:yes stop_codon:yes gene_type:complete